MKTKIFILVLAIIVIGGGLFYFLKVKGPEPPPQTQELSVVTETIKEEGEDIKYVLDVSFPKIVGMSDEAMGNRTNQDIKDYVLEFIEGFKGGTGEMELFREMKHGFYSDYVVLLLTDTLLSIRFTNSEYFSGAAHPNSLTQVFNYDITGGELIEVSDFFKSESNYLEAISEFAENELLEKFKDENELLREMIKSGTAAEAENYRNVGISEDGLIIIFDPYQVVPYALGPQEVKIPYKNLKEQIDPAGPLEFSSEPR